MIVLALDSTSDEIACEIRRGSDVMFHRRVAARSFVVDCATLLDAALLETKVGRHEIALYCVVTGPGSWTGIRVGTTFMRTMAYAGGRPIVGIPLFPFIASVFGPEKPAVAVLGPARPGVLLAGVFDTTRAPPDCKSDIALIGEAAAAERLGDVAQGIWYGNAAPPPRLAGAGLSVCNSAMIPAGSLTSAALAYLSAGAPSNPHKLSADYHIPFPATPARERTPC